MKIFMLLVLFNFLGIKASNAQKIGVKVDSTTKENIPKFPLVKIGIAWFVTYPNIRLEKNLSKKYALEAAFFHRKPKSQMLTADWYTNVGMDLKRDFKLYSKGYYLITGIRYLRLNPKPIRNFIPDSVFEKKEFNPALRIGFGYQEKFKNSYTIDLEIGGLFLHEDFKPFQPVVKNAFSFSRQYLFGKKKTSKS